jgi:NAD+ synthetase
MKLAIAQINSVVGDLEGNIKRILDAAKEAKNADLIVFPEMCLPGYPPRDILNDASFVSAVELATSDLARQTKGLPPMLVGSFKRSGQNLFNHPALQNVVHLLHNGKLEVAQVKQLLPVYDVFYEPRWFVPGEKTLPPISIAGKRIGILVCEDMWDQQYTIHPGKDLKAMGADMLVCLSASPYRRGGHAGRLRHASRQELPIVFVNLVGGNDELIFDGGGFILSGEGELLFQTKRFEAGVSVVDVDVKDPIQAEQEGTGELFRALTLGLRDFFRKNHQKNIIIGLSGGIDSSVAAVLAVEAVGASNVTGVAIPSRFTDERSTQSAMELAKRLGIQLEVIQLEKLHSTAEQVLGPERSAGKGGENIQARLRMLVLMSFVNQTRGMLLNTSNKTELTLGYSTLYGDMAGAISPLGDLTKPEVYELTRWVNRNEVIIPSFCMERKPSAELNEGQVDPFDYDVVAPEMEQFVLRDQSDARMRSSEHKRRQMGMVLKVSERAFGSGRLMPITRR